VSGFLLDTCIISELVKPRPAVHVVEWISTTDEELLYLSVLTLGEIRKGIALVPDAMRRSRLEAWLAGELPARFENRILEIGQEIAERWGRMTAQAKAANHTLPVIDGLLAATAQHHNLTLVTRNTQDVAVTGVAIFNPWE
jgi:predicted nucleic acid-binding protein